MWPIGQLKRMEAEAARMRKLLETEVKRVIIQALELEPGLRVWRNNVGTKGHIHYGLGPGSADIIGVMYSGGRGRFVALEVKRDARTEPEPHQVDWLQDVREHGGFAAVVWDVASARAAIARARNGESR